MYGHTPVLSKHKCFISLRNQDKIHKPLSDNIFAQIVELYLLKCPIHPTYPEHNLFVPLLNSILHLKLL